jgi:hypothetical protein
VAQQHIASQPIAAADRTAGRGPSPNVREASVRPGQTTPSQAARVERPQARVEPQVHNDRPASPGRQEKQPVKKEQKATNHPAEKEKRN